MLPDFLVDMLVYHSGCFHYLDSTHSRCYLVTLAPDYTISSDSHAAVELRESASGCFLTLISTETLFSLQTARLRMVLRHSRFLF